jgi:hypothetical protein
MNSEKEVTNDANGSKELRNIKKKKCFSPVKISRFFDVLHQHAK